MRVLAIDTAGSAGAVALLSEGRLVAGAELGASQEHAERVLGALTGLLDDQDWRPADLDLIVVSLGPGSFTGVRVGIAAGQGLAFGLGKPLVGVPSLEALAAWSAQVMEGQGGLYVPLLDARRGELYAGAWRPAGAGAGPALELALAPLALAPAALRESLATALQAAGPGPLVFCGDGVPIVAAELSSPTGPPWPRPIKSVNPPRPVDAAALLARLGEEGFRAGGAPPLLEPLYVRQADARRPAGAGAPPAGVSASPASAAPAPRGADGGRP